jgi:hypothetical protein
MCFLQLFITVVGSIGDNPHGYMILSGFIDVLILMSSLNYEIVADRTNVSLHPLSEATARQWNHPQAFEKLKIFERRIDSCRSFRDGSLLINKRHSEPKAGRTDCIIWRKKY